MNSGLSFLPLDVTVRSGVAVIRQRVGDLEEEVVEIQISKDQAVMVAEYLLKSFKVSRAKLDGGDDTGFDVFWAAYPRKESKSEALRVWKTKQLSGHLQTILDHIEVMKDSEQWQKGFIPHARTYLGQRRFEDEVSNSSESFADAL